MLFGDYNPRFIGLLVDTPAKLTLRITINIRKGKKKANRYGWLFAIFFVLSTCTFLI